MNNGQNSLDLVRSHRFRWADIEKITKNEIVANVGRNWGRRGYMKVPGLGYGVNEDGTPSAFNRLQVAQALFYQRATNKGVRPDYRLTLQEAQNAFIQRLCLFTFRSQNLDPDLPLHLSIGNALKENTLDEFQERFSNFNYHWLIPRDTFGNKLPLEIEVVSKAKVSERCEKFLDGGRYDYPTDIDFSDIVKIVNDGIEAFDKEFE